MKLSTTCLSAALTSSVALSGLLVPCESRAHLDPSSNPPLLTQVDVAKLVIHDALYKLWTGKYRSTLNDGPSLANLQAAELLVLAEIDWGDAHGSSFWKWTGEFTFDHVISQYYKPSYKAIGYTMPVNTNIASHMECSPMLTPVYKVHAYEVDKGSGWESELAEAIASDVGASTIAYVIKKGIGGLNGNDEITVDVGKPDGHDDEKKPEVEIEFRSSTATLPPQPACGTIPQVSHAIPANYRAPVPPGGIPQPPEVQKVTRSDDYSETERALASTFLEANPSSAAAGQRKLRLDLGIDAYHPFGRSATYAGSRFDDLLERWNRIEQTPYLGSELSQADFEHNRNHAQGILVGLAYMAAARTITEAAERRINGSDVSQSLIQSSENLMVEAALAADAGDHPLAIEGYRAATLQLLPSLYPRFVDEPVVTVIPTFPEYVLQPPEPPVTVVPPSFPTVDPLPTETSVYEIGGRTFGGETSTLEPFSFEGMPQ